jgi:hypothetical protein
VNRREQGRWSGRLLHRGREKRPSVTVLVPGVHFGTSPSRRTAYSRAMTLKNIKAGIAVAWVLVVGVAGFLAGVTSPSGWLALAGLAIVPPLVMMRFWQSPDQTMSQSIQDALRK